MKAAIYTIFSIVILIGCKDKAENKAGLQKTKKQVVELDKGEEFQDLEFSSLNEHIIKSGEMMSPKEVLIKYYPAASEADSNAEITITENKIDDKNIELRLVHNDIMDDSVRGQKIIMALKKVGHRWVVVTLKKNWRCWEGRGHTDWGIAMCS
ncbi:MAG: hypothetical protein HKN51_06285 [Saprospiraceae bacterium]|nr:hypothetical protein [Saprospiraceae bacterium]